MCLACEHYVDLCKEAECVTRAESDPAQRWNIFASRSGWTAVLWRGYGEPCDHIKAGRPDWRDEMDAA
jgi:hypothetical protein